MILTSVAAKETAEINVNEIEIKAIEKALKKYLIIFPPIFLTLKHILKRYTRIKNVLKINKFYNYYGIL
tara:strand:- start:148 stop:354 length:207 start_codon:yes stop_codon:yes gene_type:complete